MAWSLPKPRLSMRLTLAMTLGIMGALALILAITTGEFYRTLALDNQREVLTELAQISTREQLHDLEDRSHEIAMALQADPRFRAAATNQDRAALVRALHNQLNQYPVTADVIRPARLEIFNHGLEPLVSTVAEANVSRLEKGCQEWMSEARRRVGQARSQVHSAFCMSGGQPWFVMLMPMDTLPNLVHLLVVSDPIPVLARIEQRQGFAVRLYSTQGQLYASKHWPPSHAMQNTLIGEHVLRNFRDEPVLRVALLRDIGDLYERLRQTRFIVMSLAFASTVLVMLLALVVLEKTALRPLGALAEQLRRFGRERILKEDKLPHSGIAEIRELTRDFQQMTEELGRLYGDLEHMAFTDPLTNLPNRARFHDSLAESTRRHARKQTPFALLLMDLDRFKSVNDSLGHQVGDLLLQEVSVRLKSVLRESDTITRLVDDKAGGYEEKMVARLGGDEFAAILPGVATEDTATGIARKLLAVILVPFLIQGHRLSIGMSIGIALYPTHGKDIDELMRRADSAMYVAKSNQTGFAFAETMQQSELL